MKIAQHSNRTKILNNALVLFLALWSLAKQDFKLKQTPWFESFMLEVFAPLQEGTMTFKQRMDSLLEHYIFIVNTSFKNAELTAKVADLENKLFQLQEIEKENSRLKQLLQFGEEIQREKVLAQVISWDSSNEFKVLRINKGTADGIELKSPVITAQGLVGYVYRVTFNYADILTLLDQNNRVDALVTNSRSHGIVEGASQQKCFMKYVARSETVNIGDEVITAGLGNVYPKGIKLGKITKVEKESYGITQYIEVEPSVDFRKLEEVVVLLNPKTTVEVEGRNEI